MVEVRVSLFLAVVLVALAAGSASAFPIFDYSVRADDADASPSPGVDDMDASPSPTEEDDEPICFPASASVIMEDGTRKSMEELQLGDRVMVAPGLYSDVFMFTHKLSDVVHEFVDLSTVSGAKISLTKGHYMYLNGVLTAASNAKVGDSVELGDGSIDDVVSVELSTRRGLFNPQTVHGDVVVDGIRASTYTTAVEPHCAHALLSPLRSLYERLGFSTGLLDAGSSLLAKMAPKGAKEAS